MALPSKASVSLSLSLRRMLEGDNKSSYQRSRGSTGACSTTGGHLDPTGASAECGERHIFYASLLLRCRLKGPLQMLQCLGCAKKATCQANTVRTNSLDSAHDVPLTSRFVVGAIPGSADGSASVSITDAYVRWEPEAFSVLGRSLVIHDAKGEPVGRQTSAWLRVPSHG